MAVTLLITSKTLQPLGDPLDGWSNLAAEVRFNEPGTGTVDLPAWPEVVELLQPGNRLVVIRDGAIWMAGPLEEPQSGEWSADGEADPGVVKAAFSDDLARVAGYVTYPNPAATFESQTTASEATRQITATGAGSIIRTLVDENCGPGALSARRIEQMVLDSATGIGSSTAITTRFEPLIDACRTVASGDGLGFRTVQVGDQIHFQVYEPQDLTATARFSRDLGNLRAYNYTLAAPTATSQLVIGGDEGSRAFVEVTSGAHADWYRVEKVVDQSGTTNANGELTQAGALEFGNDNPTASLSTVTVDTEDLRAGIDFGLGDKVSVVLPTGLEVADIVRSIRLDVSPNEGELVTSVIGTGDQTTDTRLVKQIRTLARRLGRVETRR
ncbi:hypothetical protein GCM10010400_74510 [Streptomyces aculeolatus]|uniref:siphovirus ReqiPepy6 Gp37-like family protein n=1 Tax=Streptomyces aculeolatus TaxID=270689 RepID=UPI001CECBE7B|nr:siphovirus ReqiPepy6 Gp37-like family protein [Streptomyces aculeolatus]